MAKIWCEEVVKYGWDGDKRTVKAQLYSDEVPGTFPKTGVDVEGLEDRANIIAPSTLVIVKDAAVWMMDSEGNWHEW